MAPGSSLGFELRPGADRQEHDLAAGLKEMAGQSRSQGR